MQHVTTASEQVVLLENPFFFSGPHGYQREDIIWARACQRHGTQCTKPIEGSPHLSSFRKKMNAARHLLVYQVKTTVFNHELKNLPDAKERAKRVGWLLDDDRFTCPTDDPESDCLDDRFQSVLLAQATYDRFYARSGLRGHTNTDFLEQINGTYICLISAAVYHTLKGWRSGNWRIPSQFRESTVRIVYTRLKATWDSFPPDLHAGIIEGHKGYVKAELAKYGFITVEESAVPLPERNIEASIARSQQRIANLKLAFKRHLVSSEGRWRKGRRVRSIVDDDMIVDAVAEPEPESDEE
jgi:hypothetical protein